MNDRLCISSAPLRAIVPVVLSAFTTASASTPGDEHWDNQFGSVGASDQLYAAAVVGHRVYVGGWLTSAGNTKANFVAGYDGTNWFQLNNGVSGAYNMTLVFALGSDGTNLYAGGWFTNADNCGARNIARWDGERWEPLAGGNPNTVVESIKISGTNVWVGGDFTTNGNVQVNGIARWDGSGWQTLGAGVAGSWGRVLAIETDGQNLYAGGQFTQAGEVGATNIARWDGVQWWPMGEGFAGTVSAMAIHGNCLYAGGSFINAKLGITNLAKWDGSSWSPVGAGPNQTVRDLISDGTNLYAGGDFTVMGGIAANRIAKWNGLEWSALGAGIQGFGVGSGGMGVYKMAFDMDGRLVVVGNFSQAGGVGVSNVALWDGTKWVSLGGRTSKGMSHFIGFVQALYSDNTNLYAGGVFPEAGDTLVNGIAKWNGTSWSALGPVVNGLYAAPSTRAFTAGGGFLYAGGNFTNVGGIAAGRLAQWDGSNWRNIGDADALVRALAYDGTYLWAGGIFTNVGGVYSPGLAALGIDSGWISMGLVSGGGRNVGALAWDGMYLYAGGNFTSVGGVSAQNIARFDGASWAALGSGVNGSVSAIAVTNGVVYVGGSFTVAGGGAANHVAKWEGSTWSALGSGLTGSSSDSVSVSAIALHGNDMYAAGTFTNAGSVYVPGIAKWDGSSWSGLGSGLNKTSIGRIGRGQALAFVGNDLFVGGDFVLAGDKPGMFISRWNDQLNFYPPPHPWLRRQAWLPTGQFQFRVTGTSGELYVLQMSSDLRNWTPVLTNSTPLYDFTDATALSRTNRFYRAVLDQ